MYTVSVSTTCFSFYSAGFDYLQWVIQQQVHGSIGSCLISLCPLVYSIPVHDPTPVPLQSSPLNADTPTGLNLTAKSHSVQSQLPKSIVSPHLKQCPWQLEQFFIWTFGCNRELLCGYALERYLITDQRRVA